MKRKAFILMAFVAVMVLMVSSLVSAATRDQTFITPLAAGTMSGTTYEVRVEVNGTLYKQEANGANIGGNVSVVNISYTPSGGVKTFWCSNTSNINNGTVQNWTVACDTSSLKDALSYTITADVANKTGILNTTSVAGVLIGNTEPVVTFPQAANSVFSTNLAAFTVTAVNASSCTIQFGSNSVAAMTLSGTTCSYTLDNTIVPDSSYLITVKAVDLSGSTTTATQNDVISLRSSDEVTGQPSGSAIVAAAQQAQQQQTKTVAIIAAVAIIAYFVFFKK